MLITSLGLLAAVLTSLSSIPQVRKARPRTLIILAAGLGLWILKGDWVIVIANSFRGALVALLAFKFRDMRYVFR